MRRIVAVLTLVLLALTGCRVEGSLDVAVSEDGSGRVRISVVLDDDALARLGDPATELKLTDLEAAGWTVEAPERSGVLTSIGVSKSFGSPGDLQRVLDEVAGVGMFVDWRVTLSDGFASRSWGVTGSIRVAGNLEQFSDDEVATQLDGLKLGRTADDLRSEFGGEPTVPLKVTVHLPAQVSSASAGAAGVDADSRMWSLDVARGGEQRVAVALTADQENSWAWRWLIGGGTLATLAMLVLLLRRRRS